LKAKKKGQRVRLALEGLDYLWDIGEPSLALFRPDHSRLYMA